MNGAARPSWFGRLRHDSRFFAALGLILVLLQSLQPLAVAQSASGGHFVICTSLGAEPAIDGSPVQHEGCDSCVLGTCGLHAVGKAITASTEAWAPVAALAFASLVVVADTLGAPPAPNGPPGIRAPPAFA